MATKNNSKPDVDFGKYWSSAFDHMEDFVFIIDKDFTIVEINNSFLSFAGMAKSDIVGKKCYNLVHEKDEPLQLCPHKRLLGTGKFENSEFYENTLNKWLHVKVTPIFDEGHKLIGSIHIATDVSEQKRMDKEIQERISALERFQKVTVDRELKMKELKKEIAELQAKTRVK